MPGVPGVQSPMSALIPDAQYAINGSPDWLAITEDSVWVNSKPTDMIFRMDPRSNEVVATVPVKKPCSGFAVAAGTLWSPSCEEKVIYRVDLVTNKVVAKVPVGPADTEGGIAFGSGSAWMPSDPQGIVSRIDPATNKVIAQIKVPPDSFTAVYGYGLVWVSSTAKSVVSVIHPATNEVIAEIPVGPNPRFMAAGEGYVWTLNQGTGSVTKIDPYTKRVVATIEVGVPGTGGDIAAGEGAVWVSERTIPVSRIDPSSNKVTVQFCGPGGDALRVGHGSVWLSNGRLSTVWRFLPEKAAARTWTRDAQKADLDGDGKPDILVEDLITYIPGERVQFRMKLINPNLSGAFILKTTLNGKKAETPFVRSGEEWMATFPGAPEPRWIHYSVCAASKCTPELVVASPTTSVAFATSKTKFVPDGFLAPEPPQVGSHKWHILEPEILKQDFEALMNMAGATAPKSITPDEDYGELKRHRWEFQRSTSFAYGILSPDEKVEVACVYVNPSKKQGYDAMVRIWVTEQGAREGLDSLLEAKVREWIKQKWPFQKVIYPGRDMPMPAWNALKDATD
jgi:virginiamycin B lyase